MGFIGRKILDIAATEIIGSMVDKEWEKDREYESSISEEYKYTLKMEGNRSGHIRHIEVYDGNGEKRYLVERSGIKKSEFRISDKQGNKIGHSWEEYELFTNIKTYNLRMIIDGELISGEIEGPENIFDKNKLFDLNYKEWTLRGKGVVSRQVRVLRNGIDVGYFTAPIQNEWDVILYFNDKKLEKQILMLYFGFRTFRDSITRSRFDL